MEKQTFSLWGPGPNIGEEMPTIDVFLPENPMSDCGVVVFPGGGYCYRTPGEGEGYAKFLQSNGIPAFVCNYRIRSCHYPDQLLDARHAIQFVRHRAEAFGVCKEKIAVMGSSAGGHLAALTCTYLDRLDGAPTDEISLEDFVPNAQILCYPVIKLDLAAEHEILRACVVHFLGENQLALADSLCPADLVCAQTPPCFLWHTWTDEIVPVRHSLDYAKALMTHRVPVELHIFPAGGHGLGLALGDDPQRCHVSQWKALLLKWLALIDFL